MGSYEPALKKARSSYDPTADALHDHTIANGHCAAYDVTVSAAALEDDTAPGVDPELGGQLQHAAPHYYSNGAANGNGNGNGNGIGSANGNGNGNSNSNGNGAHCSDCNGVSHYADPQEQQHHHQQLQGDLECRRYTTTEGCPYGSQCRFKHGPSDERDLGQQPSALGSKTRPCIKFFSTAGCPYGEGCHFLHYVPGGITALGLAPYSSVNPTATSAGVRKVVGGVGPAGTANGANAADPSVTVGGYKTRLCNRYNTPEGCRFADKCHFAHGESDLRPSNGRNGAPPLLDLSGASGIYSNGLPAYNPVGTSVYYGEPTPPGVSATCCFGATSTTKMSIEAVFAGAIIGKAGSNVKQISRLTGAKLSIRDHENDPNMRNVEMEGSLEQIEKAREMVRNFLQNREVQPARPASLGSHNFKTKLCENYAQGTCTFADRCHFAHAGGRPKDK